MIRKRPFFCFRILKLCILPWSFSFQVWSEECRRRWAWYQDLLLAMRSLAIFSLLYSSLCHHHALPHWVLCEKYEVFFRFPAWVVRFNDFAGRVHALARTGTAAWLWRRERRRKVFKNLLEASEQNCGRETCPTKLYSLSKYLQARAGLHTRSNCANAPEIFCNLLEV